MHLPGKRPFVALIRDFGKSPPKRADLWLCAILSRKDGVPRRFPKPPDWTVGMARRSQKLPDYFTPDEAEALVAAAPSYPTRVAFRIMLRTGLRVSEALALRRSDLRPDQDPPLIMVRADSPGNKAQEVPVPADLVESPRDLAAVHRNDHYRPMMDIPCQQIGQVM